MICHKLPVFALAALVMGAMPALAGSDKHEGHPGKGHGKHQDGASAPAERAGGGAGLSISFDLRERDAILSYYAGNPRAAQPSSLPPGIAKNLARGKPLPPGIAKRALPPDLDIRLPARDPRYGRIIVGNDVLLIDISANLVIDIIRDVFR